MKDTEKKQKGLYQLSFVKSALTSNPNSNNHSHVILQAEDRIFFTPHSEERRGSRNQINSVGSKQWTVIQMPCNYLSGNWPIRFSAVDSKGFFYKTCRINRYCRRLKILQMSSSISMSSLIHF